MHENDKVPEGAASDYLNALARALPEVFAGPRIGDLTGGAFTWESIRTRKSRGLIPQKCFGKRIGNGPTPMLREPFIRWVAETVAGERSTNAPDQAA